jgi:hypothetical protein
MSRCDAGTEEREESPCCGAASDGGGGAGKHGCAEVSAGDADKWGKTGAGHGLIAAAGLLGFSAEGPDL